MAAFKYKAAINQGETYSKTFTWKAGQPAVAVDLTGCTARMQVRERIDSPTVLIELTTENGRIVLGGPAGTIRLLISSADTSAITWRAGVYDLEVVHADGTVRRLISGSVAVSPEVTR